MQNDSNEIISASWTIIYQKQGLFSPERFNIVITNQTEGDILKINFDLENEQDIQPQNIISWNNSVLLNPTLDLINLTCNSGETDLYFNIKGTDFGTFDVETTKGDIEIYLNRSIIFNDFLLDTVQGEIKGYLDLVSINGDIICNSKSSLVYLNLWDIEFLSEGTLDIFSETGKINTRWASHYKKSHKVNINLKSGFDIEFQYWSPFEISRYDVIFEETTGDAYLGTPTDQFDEISPNHYQSINIDDNRIDLLRILVNTTSGDIYVNFIDCFKPNRFCGRRAPGEYSVETSSSFQISKSQYDVSTIKLSNEIENINIEAKWLPSTSEYIFKANWNLTYTKGSNHGFGDIDVVITNQTIDDTLQIYIDINYERDRIKPIFDNYIFTVYINPNYNFIID